MSRLLFAAARGARIEGSYHNWKSGGTEWRETDDLNKFGNRIHPDDEHLQYGPISTLLREMALTGECDGTDIPYVRITLLTEEGYWKSNEDQQCVFCLILAECSADEGM